MKIAVLREGEVEKTKRHARDVRKTVMFWKTIWFLTLLLQNTRFSRLNWLVSESPKSLEPRFWKISLSFFCNWDLHSPVSRERLWMNSYLTMSREPFWVNLRLELWKLVTYEWVAKRQSWKFLDFSEIFQNKILSINN